MWRITRLKIGERFQRLVQSIAFYPAALGLAFLLLSFISIEFDFSTTGKALKSQLRWLSLRDATTARSIISSIVAGVISLTVFSFSMVMIVLNQAASQMSNRVLDKLIGNRFQQLVLGAYIGTIVYALFLLSTIRDIDSGIYIPALSTYLLIVLTVLDIFLFIYFLHYITRSVKYEVIIQRIYEATEASMLQSCCLQEAQPAKLKPDYEYVFYSSQSGVYEGVSVVPLLSICETQDCAVAIIPVQGSYILKGTPIMTVNKPLECNMQQQIMACVRVHEVETIEGNFFYGFKQLMEIAIKALSPGINDPDTAVISIRSLFRLYLFRLRHFPEDTYKDTGGLHRVAVTSLSFEKIFNDTLLPIWDYGKKDRILTKELQQLLSQLQALVPNTAVGSILLLVEQEGLKN